MVLSRLISSLKVHLVCQVSIKTLNSGGKSDPISTIQETYLEFASPAARRAPRAAYVPAPPRIFSAGTRPLRYSIWSAASQFAHIVRSGGSGPIINMPNVQKATRSSILPILAPALEDYTGPLHSTRCRHVYAITATWIEDPASRQVSLTCDPLVKPAFFELSATV